MVIVISLKYQRVSGQHNFDHFSSSETIPSYHWEVLCATVWRLVLVVSYSILLQSWRILGIILLNSDVRWTKIQYNFHISIQISGKYNIRRDLYSSVSKLTVYFLDHGVRFATKERMFSSQRPDQLSGPPTLQWVPRALSPAVNRPGCEADHSSSSAAEVKNARSYNSTPAYLFLSWCLIKHRDKFTTYLTSLRT
jgi:hypothetical protein